MALKAGKEAAEVAVAAKVRFPLLQLFSLLWFCEMQVILALQNRRPLELAESEFRCTAVFFVDTADSERRLLRLKSSAPFPKLTARTQGIPSDLSALAKPPS